MQSECSIDSPLRANRSISTAGEEPSAANTYRDYIVMESPILKTERTELRLASQEDAASVLDFFIRNRVHLSQWDPARPQGFFTEEYWKSRIRQNAEEFRLGVSCRMFVWGAEKSGQVIGTVNFSQVFRGSFHACYLGYSLDAEHEGQGLMSEAVRVGIDYIFEDWNLHRIMANYIPRNVRSGRLLRRLGFVPEGYAKAYLRINGVWEDHILTSLTNPAWRESKE